MATVLGTLIAMALVRYGFRGRGATNLLIFLPMATPEIVMGASLLTLFLNLGVKLGLGTIILAHIMFNISYVVVTVKARLVGFDRHLEEAAMDLYANEMTTFRKVTLPLIAPALLAGALIAFSLSIDDFVITLSGVRRADNLPPLRVGERTGGGPAADQRDRHHDLRRRHHPHARERHLPTPSQRRSGLKGTP